MGAAVEDKTDAADTQKEDTSSSNEKLVVYTNSGTEGRDAYLIEKAKEAGEAVRAAYGEDTSYLSFLASGGQFFVFTGAGFGSVLYEDMGLAKPEGLPEQSDISLPVVTYEGLASIGADYIFLMATDEDKAELDQNAVWNSLPAVQSGQVVELPASPYFNQGYSPIGRELLLDEILEMLDGTAKN